MNDFVYVIGPESGPYKVGRTSSLVKRLAVLQTGSPVRLVLHFHQESTRLPAKDVEWMAHMKLRGFHLWGEWFDCSLERAIEAIAEAFKHAQPTKGRTLSLEQEYQRLIRITSGMTDAEWAARPTEAIIAGINAPRLSRQEIILRSAAMQKVPLELVEDDAAVVPGTGNPVGTEHLPRKKKRMRRVISDPPQWIDRCWGINDPPALG